MEMAGVGEACLFSNLTQGFITTKQMLCCEGKACSQGEGPEANPHGASEEVVESRRTQAAGSRCIRAADPALWSGLNQLDGRDDPGEGSRFGASEGSGLENLGIGAGAHQLGQQAQQMQPDEVGPEWLLLFELTDHVAANGEHALSQNETCAPEPPIGREGERAQIGSRAQGVLTEELRQEDQEYLGGRRSGDSPRVRLPGPAEPDIAGAAPEPEVPILVLLLARQEQAYLQPLMGMETEALGFIARPGIAVRQRLRGASWSALGLSLARHGFSGVEAHVARKGRYLSLGVGPIADDGPGIF
jgi:hypothetical protein